MDEQAYILVVDDNEMNRDLLSRRLKRQGYGVATAENGVEALKCVAAEQFDLILLDIMMPEMNGFEVLEHLKANDDWRHIPVIVISAAEDIDNMVKGIQLGAEDYLPKNYNPVFLRARIESSLRRKKLRDLEQAYLQQEVMLRQSEKLATLGRLSAGMAHELNNPASAALSGSQALHTTFERLLMHSTAISAAGFSPEQTAAMEPLIATIKNADDQSDLLDPIERSDRESELEIWLEDAGVEDAWEFTDAMVKLGLQEEDLQNLSSTYNPEQLTLVIRWLVDASSTVELIKVISEGTGRISGIVGALKTYTYLDQAPVQNVDIHEGLNNTLLMLNSRLKKGITVHRHYDESLPLVEAYGSELNQVWTNIIDNAISAMDGQGEIMLTTAQENGWVVIEIADNGPGIPEDVQRKIFDPFFTTKPPGEGTGLGLNISHNIIVEKHQGEISVDSRAGETRFQIKLPLESAASNS